MEILHAADLLLMKFFMCNWMDALSIQCLWHNIKRVLCFAGQFAEAFQLPVAHDAWPLPFFVTAGAVLCFLPSPWQPAPHAIVLMFVHS